MRPLSHRLNWRYRCPIPLDEEHARDLGYAAVKHLQAGGSSALITKPNGRIITTVKNGTLVAIDDSTAGNRWSRISITRGRKSIIGWVLRDYLSCG
jgi:hypothetical protein